MCRADENRRHRLAELMAESPAVLINGFPVEAADPAVSRGDTDPVSTTVTFDVDARAPDALYRIGSPVIVQFGDFGPSLCLVTGLEARLEAPQPRVLVQLREVGPAPIDDRTKLLHGAVYQTIMHRVRLRALLDLLEETGVIASEAYESRVIDVVDQQLVELASEIVSLEDAEAMRDFLLQRLRSARTPEEEAVASSA